MDEGEFEMIGSLNLSLAYDIVNVNSLWKSLEIINLPDDVISLIRSG
jgi:hypothetical protein